MQLFSVCGRTGIEKQLQGEADLRITAPQNGTHGGQRAPGAVAAHG
jgi:hypothetical protein